MATTTSNNPHARKSARRKTRLITTRGFAANYFSTLAVMALAYWIIFDLSGFHRGMIQAQWQFGNLDIDFVITIHRLLTALIAFYAVILIPYYLRYPWLHSKAFVFLQGLWFSLLRCRRPVSRARAARGAKKNLSRIASAACLAAGDSAALIGRRHCTRARREARQRDTGLRRRSALNHRPCMNTNALECSQG